jgi:gamma-glutamylcyclotransferase (GGCT)/AIG2-like uncharacterized protein YtfP
LWRLRDADKILGELDDYEGADFSRVLVDVVAPARSAWIYLYNGQVDAERRIASGDFLAP